MNKNNLKTIILFFAAFLFVCGCDPHYLAKITINPNTDAITVSTTAASHSESVKSLILHAIQEIADKYNFDKGPSRNDYLLVQYYRTWQNQPEDGQVGIVVPQQNLWINSGSGKSPSV